MSVQWYPARPSLLLASQVSPFPLLLAGDGGTVAGAELGVAEVTLAARAELLLC